MNITQTIKAFAAAGLFALGLGGAQHAQASVVIAGTRVVYPAQEKEVTVKLSNVGKAPALLQAWLDKGDPQAAPSAIDVPFTVTPPVSRIDAGKGQTLRIIYTGEPLPRDKESVFWLNVLEVPPKPGAEQADVNKLQLAFRSRIKLFFRPDGLKGLPADAPARITWRLTRDAGQAALEASNPTPYHVSFGSLELTGGGAAASSIEGGMVGPGQTQRFPLKGDVSAGAGAEVHYHAINDYGGAIDGKAAL